MKSIKTVLLWIAIYGVQLLGAMLIGLIWGLFGISTEFDDIFAGLISILFIGSQILVMGYLASKVRYRYRDAFLQFIPVYGIFWTFRILYRTIERWTKN